MKWIVLALLVGVLKHLGVMAVLLAPIHAARRFRRSARRGADASPESGGRAPR
jgi:hypothetical protein